ncbi:MAG: phosphopyruvate hydratase, partial [Dehalococcoidia bacterium]|nr:phosphopyruvate hydratase [Dehalococcoidia bacterium]
GTYEAKFIYDGGERWGGRGVEKVVSNIENIIAPALKGKDVTRQEEIDRIMIELDGTPDKSHLGANATASVSAAVLKAGAASLGIPLYRHVGGVNACTIPIPIIGLGTGGRYRDPGKTRWLKPSFEFSAYGAGSFVEALRYSTQCVEEVQRLLTKRYPDKYQPALRTRTLAGVINDDREFLDIMTESINNCGYEGKIGIYFDCAADCYYEKDIDKYVGIFAPGEKTRDEMIDMYKDFVNTYPLVSFEDPLREDDYEGIATITKETGIEVVGDDLFTTNVERLKKGIAAGSANSMVLKMTQVGTVSEAFAACRLARANGYNIHPCGSRGDIGSIGDIAVGLNTGQIRGTDNNRMAAIEEELGANAVWLGKAAYNGWRNKASL